MIAPHVEILSNDDRAGDIVRENWNAIEAALALARADDVVFLVEDGGVYLERRRPLLRRLRRELRGLSLPQLEKPAPAGAFVLVLLFRDAIGTALVRPVASFAGAA